MRNSIQNYLHADGAAGSVMAHAGLLLRLNGVLERIVPINFRGAVRVANVKAGKIIILAENGSVAVKLRQMATRLQASFIAAGAECKSIDVKVQPSENHYETKASHQKPLSSISCGSLQGFANTLSADDPLRVALEHLIHNAAHAEI
jgi:hypothetical protein